MSPEDTEKKELGSDKVVHESIVLQMATQLHDLWKVSFIKQNPEATSRIKIKVMGKWRNYPQDLENLPEDERAIMEKIEAENPNHDTPGVCEDILNTPFEKLSYKWQEENIGAARFALELVSTSPAKDTELLAERVHENWSKNNSWDELAQISYRDLPDIEKEKDRQQVVWAKQILEIS